MVRFYNNKYPAKGENIIVRIDDNSSINIKCSLLEYNDIEGMICSVDKSRWTSKSLKKLKVGDIIPVLCSDVFVKKELDNEVVYIDLIYAAMEKERIKCYKDRFEKIQRIIMFFSDLVESTDEIFSQKEIDSKVKAMVKESLHTMSKDEIVSLFYNNITELHKVALTWSYCNSISDFMEKIVKKFPKPDITLNVTVEMSCTQSFGTKTIKDTCKLISDKMKIYDDQVEFSIKLIAIPNYQIIIKSAILMEQNVKTYFNHLCTNIMECEIDGLTINIKQHSIDTSNEMKIEFLTEDIENDI